MEKLHIQFHNTLNKDFWDKESLDPKVKEALLTVAKEFIKFLKIDDEPEDIHLIGSLANYNYTELSDVDIHIIVDFKKVGDDLKFVKEYFDAKKYVWNMEHDIKIYGHEIECYVQDVNEENASIAIYSVLNNKWIKKPEIKYPKIDTKAVLVKAKDFSKRIEMAKGDLESLTDLKEKIKSMRKSGLDKYGEYSTENLVFKALRNSNKIKKLADYAKNIYDQELSLKEKYDIDWKELVN